MTDARRRIPSVERMLESPHFEAILLEHPRGLVLANLRNQVEQVRQEIAAGSVPSDVESVAAYAEAVVGRLDRALTPSLRPVINATGILLHTGLGRAPLADEAITATPAVCRPFTEL